VVMARSTEGSIMKENLGIVLEARVWESGALSTSTDTYTYTSTYTIWPQYIARCSSINIIIRLRGSGVAEELKAPGSMYVVLAPAASDFEPEPHKDGHMVRFSGTPKSFPRKAAVFDLSLSNQGTLRPPCLTCPSGGVSIAAGIENRARI